MNFDIKRMIESKKAFRRKLASRPIAEKLEMLDILRERTVAIREAARSRRPDAAREQQTNCRTGKK